MKFKKLLKKLDLKLLGNIIPFIIALTLRVVAPKQAVTLSVQTLIAVYYLSFFIKQSVINIRYGIIGIDLLVAIAAIGAAIIGEPWESVSVSFLFVLGKQIEAKALFRSNEHVRQLIDTLPSSVRMENGEMRKIHAVTVGDRIKVLQGEIIPVDGIIFEGNAWVNESSVTGESVPIEKETSDTLFMGSLLVEGYALIEVQATGESTIYGSILELVEDAQNKKGTTQTLIDRFARIYTPIVFILAMGAGLLTRDIHIALSLLVVSCPGALVIAIPIASAVALNKATKHHILVKGVDVLEKLRDVEVIAFDKTGTLSQNKIAVSDIIEGAKDSQEVLELAANMEYYSEHPIAQAILRAHPLKQSRFESIDFYPGKGLVAMDGSTLIRVGNHKLFNLEAPNFSQTAVYVGSDEALYGTILCEDTVREEAFDVISVLKDYKIMMLTGDHHGAAEKIAEKIGIEQVYANLLPNDKLQIVESHPKLMMVGDGVNDALALMSSYVGVSMGGVENAVALEAADVILVDKDLRHIPWLFTLSAKVQRIMRQNILIASFSVLALLIGVLDSRIHMSMGMLIHEISVLLVIVNALRLRR